MPHIDLPDGQDPGAAFWSEYQSPISIAGLDLSRAVYGNTRLSMREFEGARRRIALINGCQLCLGWRSARDIPAYVGPDAGAGPQGAAPDEAFYEAVADWRSSKLFSERERLAIEFAERFAEDHRSLDEAGAFWTALHSHFSDAEIADLSLCVSYFLGFGRLVHVLGLDGACPLTPH